MIKFQQSQTLTSHFESFWSIVPIWICFRTPLHYAAANGHMDIIMKLVEYNADVDIEDYSGTNAYKFAVAYGHMDAAEYLESLWS